MLWTIMPAEFIAEPVEPGELEVVCYEGRQLLVHRRGELRVISRLISTDAADYLDPRFQPGRELKMRVFQ